MSTALTKRTAKLETDFWSKAKPVELPACDEVFSLVRKDLMVLLHLMLTHWSQTDPQAKSVGNAYFDYKLPPLPPVHSAFLPDEDEDYRIKEWALYHCPDYLEAERKFWEGFLSQIKSNYDLSGEVVDII